MDVTSVILSYTLLENANAAASLFSSSSPNEIALGASGTFANTPTVTYQPLTGDRFMKSMLRPIPPAGMFQMLQTGWSAEMLLRNSVSTINGLRNSFRGGAADPRFDQLVAAVSRLQRAGGLNIRIEQRRRASWCTSCRGRRRRRVPTRRSRTAAAGIGLTTGISRPRCGSHC